MQHIERRSRDSHTEKRETRIKQTDANNHLEPRPTPRERSDKRQMVWLKNGDNGDKVRVQTNRPIKIDRLTNKERLACLRGGALEIL
jgi:hypothetical protein